MNYVICKLIDEHYYWECYGELEVIVMNKTGYINATKMCIDRNKNFNNWLEDNKSKTIIDSVSNSISIPSKFLLINITKGIYKIQGVYIHRKLIPIIIEWISPLLMCRLNKIVNEYLLNKDIKEKYKFVEDNTNDDIDKLQEKFEAIKLKTDKAIEENRIAYYKLKEVVLDINETKIKLNNDSLVCSDRVILAKDSGKINTFVIMKINNNEKKYQYHAIRRQKTSVNRTIQLFYIKNVKAEIIMKLDYNPNSIMLFNVVKERLKYNIDINRNDFNIIGLTENDFVSKIEAIHEERNAL